MSVEKNTYELTYIVNAVISDDQIKDLIRRVTAYVSESGGEIMEVEEWGSRRLAFPIQKKRNGHYVNMYFRAAGTMIARMERALEIDDNILRYLTLKMDAKMIRHYEKRKAADPDAIGLIAEERTRGSKDRDSSDKITGAKKPFVDKKSEDASTAESEGGSTATAEPKEDKDATPAEKNEKPEGQDVMSEEKEEKDATPAEKDEKPEGQDVMSEEKEEKDGTPAEKDEKPEEKDATPEETESSADDSPEESTEEKSDASDAPVAEAAEVEGQAEDREKTDA
ncbi:MAG: hypothetical protein BMS9Abin05_1443 [Rhodothermia bacterium]|nr:MAG: hypothetical protein BMS9Abin05_1443 [Rhodothermia bacterium]